jgi:hypothetical protein
MLPFMANDTAFMNSVVLGTSANSVTPKNFSSMPEPFSTTSTTSTSNSVVIGAVPISNMWRSAKIREGAPTGDDGIQRRACQQYARANRTTPRRRFMSAMPGRIFIISKLTASHTPRLHLLVSQSRHGGDSDSASKIVGRKLRGLQTRILQRVIDAFKNRNKGSGRGTRGSVGVRSGTQGGRRGRGSGSGVVSWRSTRVRRRRIRYDDVRSMANGVRVSLRPWPRHPGYEVGWRDYLMI